MVFESRTSNIRLMTMCRVLVVVLLSVLTTAQAAEQCQKTGACKAVCSQGVVDLTPLANTDGTARFWNVSRPNGQFVYSFNPCTPFSEGPNPGECQNVSVCKTDGQTYNNIGNDSTAVFQYNGKQLQLKYEYVTDDLTTSIINLHCANTESLFIANGQTDSNTYTFDLSTKYACYDDSSTIPTVPGPQSTVTITSLTQSTVPASANLSTTTATLTSTSHGHASGLFHSWKNMLLVFSMMIVCKHIIM